MQHLNFLRKKGFGALKDKDDYRDLYYEMISGGEWEDMIVQLPYDFKLNYDNYWRYNQGKTSACVFHGATGILNYLYQAKLSPRYLTKYGKKISNLAWGAYTRDGVKAAVTYGTCLYEHLPNTDKNTISDTVYLDFETTKEIQNSANMHKAIGYVRADSQIGNDFDSVRKFIYETKSPVIISFPYYYSYNGTKDNSEFIKEGINYLGHIALCIGWMDDKYIFVDSYDRTVYMDRRNPTWDAWGITDFKKVGIKIPKKPPTRDIKLEQENALVLQKVIYDRFAIGDHARQTAGLNWFRLINAKTYKEYTFIDLVNWVYNLDRKGKELFDIEKPRNETIN